MIKLNINSQITRISDGEVFVVCGIDRHRHLIRPLNFGPVERVSVKTLVDDFGVEIEAPSARAVTDDDQRDAADQYAARVAQAARDQSDWGGLAAQHEAKMRASHFDEGT